MAKKEPSWDKIGKMIGSKVDKEFKNKKGQEDSCCKPRMHHGCGGAIYGLGFIGAAIYYISTATGFWNGVYGVLKAIVWPAMLVYKLLGM